MPEPTEFPEYHRYGYHRARGWKPLRQWVVYLLVRLMLALATWLPIAMLQGIGRGVGSVAYRFSSKLRELCLAQLAMALPGLPPEDHRRIARECLRQQGMTLMETLALPRLRRNSDYWMAIEGEQALREAHAEGKGVVLVTAHTGNWEMISIALERLGVKTLAFATPMNNPLLQKLIIRLRETEFFAIAGRGSEDSPRQLLRSLKQGETLMMVNDVDIDTNGVFVNFFGLQANTPRAGATLPLKVGCPVVTGFDRRLPGGTHCIEFERVPVTAEIREADDPVRTLTQELARRTEAHIRLHPHQWVWNHRRWRRRPPEAN